MMLTDITWNFPFFPLLIPMYKSVTTLLYIEKQNQHGFLNEEMA